MIRKMTDTTNPHDNGKGANELMGFVVFEPGLNYSEDGIVVTFRKTIIRLSMRAVTILGFPENIVVFLDYRTHRMMIKPATDKMQNRIAMKKSQNKKSRVNRYIQSKALMDQVSTMIGKNVREINAVFEGHQADVPEPTLIFHLEARK